LKWIGFLPVTYSERFDNLFLDPSTTYETETIAPDFLNNKRQVGSATGHLLGWVLTAPGPANVRYRVQFRFPMGSNVWRTWITYTIPAFGQNVATGLTSRMVFVPPLPELRFSFENLSGVVFTYVEGVIALWSLT